MGMGLARPYWMKWESIVTWMKIRERTKIQQEHNGSKQNVVNRRY
jgi:hypothetical protein